MSDPVVSFIVPCYKLAHLLPECVNSILAQSYSDFEILIMDDCSPDYTPEVARSFRDSRVKHIRNEPNLGNLRNYNKGIGLSRGKYVWLISADDYLRRNYVLQRYVDLLESNLQVGYVFCPGVGVRNGQETGVLEYSKYGESDAVINGHVFLKRLLRWNIVLAASGMVRRECYQRLGMFPLQKEMAWSGDWYLWCLFALHHDVGYFAEPMVCYRQHELNMTNSLRQESVELVLGGDVAVPWMIKHEADKAGYRTLSKACLQVIVNAYVQNITSTEARWYRMCQSYMSLKQFGASLSQNFANEMEQNWVTARVHAGIADWHYWRRDRTSARRFYLRALQKDPWMAKVCAKTFLVSLGKAGELIRELVLAAR